MRPSTAQHIRRSAAIAVYSLLILAGLGSGASRSYPSIIAADEVRAAEEDGMPAGAATGSTGASLTPAGTGTIVYTRDFQQELKNFFKVQQEKLLGKFCPGSGSSGTAKIKVKILNRGASASDQRKIQKLLAGEEKYRVVIGREKGPEVEEYAIFFKEEKFREEAQFIAELMREKENIYAYARAGESEEEKSADIVVKLGKSKEAPPN